MRTVRLIVRASMCVCVCDLGVSIVAAPRIFHVILTFDMRVLQKSIQHLVSGIFVYVYCCWCY